MILYLDTSSLLKLYVREEGTEEVTEAVGRAEVVATSAVAFAETRSAFARLAREGQLTPEELGSLREDFHRDWERFLEIPVQPSVYRRAGDLAEEHALRGFDSLHLASFLELRDQPERPEVSFSAFDDRLVAAAAAEEEKRVEGEER